MKIAILGMVKYAKYTDSTEKTFVAISSGANMDFDRLRFVSERADSSETLMCVSIPEQAGTFRKLYQTIHPRNVTEISYRHNGTSMASVIVSFQALPGKSVEEDKDTMIDLLNAQVNYIHIYLFVYFKLYMSFFNISIFVYFTYLKKIYMYTSNFNYFVHILLKVISI